MTTSSSLHSSVRPLRLPRIRPLLPIALMLGAAAFVMRQRRAAAF